MDIVPDYNRDGKIDELDRGKVTTENPWRFWVNDDRDIWTEERRSSGDDTPANSGGYIANNETPDVDGPRDLLDFFPLHFDLEEVLKVFPADQYKYVIKQKDEAIKYYEFPAVVLDASDDAHAPHTHLRNINYTRNHRRQTLKKIFSVGQELSSEFLTQAKDGKGIILCEGVKNSTKPLVLEIKKNDGTLLGKVEFPLSISSVKDMYRKKYFHPNDPEVINAAVIPGSPSNWPDDKRNDKHFVFVIGYNVSATQAQGWHAEMFKRLYWSGSNARFTGITWSGNENQIVGIDATPDYWSNVINAFQTSKSVQQFVTLLPGDKSIAAHSLGNMVIGSAIKDHELIVEKYFMIDAAVAVEAYQYSQEDLMRPSTWSGYESKLWPTEWYDLFKDSPSDGRNKLTWRMRFDSFPNAYNCYSWEEEVLEDGNGTEPGVFEAMGHRSWVKQEMSKGKAPGGGGLFHDVQGGWEFGKYGHVRLDEWVRYTRAEANDLTDDQLKVKTFFKPFNDPDIVDVLNGSAAAADYQTQSGLQAKPELLAEAIPAYSFAAGSNEMVDFQDRNISMMSYQTNAAEWPIGGPYDHRAWLHSDIRDVGYMHNYKLFDKFVAEAELK